MRLGLVQEIFEWGQSLRRGLTHQYDTMDKTMLLDEDLGGRRFENIKIQLGGHQQNPSSITLGWEEVGYSTRICEEITVAPSTVNQPSTYSYKRAVFDRNGEVVGKPKEATCINGQFQARDKALANSNIGQWSFHQERLKTITEVLGRTQRVIPPLSPH